MLKRINEVAKAVAAALGAGYLAYQAAKGLGTPAGLGVTFGEWVDVAFASLVVGAGVYFVPNAKPVKPADGYASVKG